MDASDDTQLSRPARKGGRYSKAFKADMISACQRPGASPASVAMAHGVSANLLRRWLSEHQQCAVTAGAVGAQQDGFVQLAAPALQPDPKPCTDEERIHVSLCRGDLQVSLSLPGAQHSQCAALLKLLLS